MSLPVQLPEDIPMLDATIKTQLTAYLEKLQQPIELLPAWMTAPRRRKCWPAARHRQPVAKVTLNSNGQAARRPSFAIARPGEAGVHFAGIPMGHEFTSLVLALLQTGGHPPKVDEDTIDQIRGLQGSFQFETFISLSCHNCPDVVQAVNLMAVLNPNVPA
jgi:alkyl hydroperoxide reductase subunit F